MQERAVHQALRKLRRARHPLDFSDYLELRRLRDLGASDPHLEELIVALERALHVPFADAIPHLVTLEPGSAPPPRDLTREALRVVFAMREEFATHGSTRSDLMGFDLPDGRGLKDWLDFIETERQQAKVVREALRKLDGKIWAVMTGERRLPTCTL